MNEEINDHANEHHNKKKKISSVVDIQTDSNMQQTDKTNNNNAFGTRTLEKDDDIFAFNAWDNVEPDEEYKAYAQERLIFHKENPVLPEQALIYNSNPDKYWDIFYGKNQNRFFKDRNWFYIEFPELFSWTKQLDQNFLQEKASANAKARNLHDGSEAGPETKPETEPETESETKATEAKNITETGTQSQLGPVSSAQTGNSAEYQDQEQRSNGIDSKNRHMIMELGCGAGNSVFPLLKAITDPKLFVYACDFSKTAVQVLKNNEMYEKDRRCSAFVWDITQESLPESVTEGSVDTILCIFVLSAVHPSKMPTAVNNFYKLLKPGGQLLFRDYGKYDLAQVRLKKNRLLEDDFYIRGDGTRVFFFENSSIKNLFADKFDIVQNGLDKRLITNRHRKIKMHRVWVQAKLIKKYI